jgi:hypothetical protein
MYQQQQQHRQLIARLEPGPQSSATSAAADYLQQQLELIASLAVTLSGS